MKIHKPIWTPETQAQINKTWAMGEQLAKEAKALANNIRKTRMKLWKTTIVVWSEYNPEDLEMELVDIAHEATDGNMYCSWINAKEVEAEKDEHWDGTEFFYTDNEDIL